MESSALIFANEQPDIPNSLGEWGHHPWPLDSSFIFPALHIRHGRMIYK